MNVETRSKQICYSFHTESQLSFRTKCFVTQGERDRILIDSKVLFVPYGDIISFDMKSYAYAYV